MRAMIQKVEMEREKLIFSSQAVEYKVTVGQKEKEGPGVLLFSFEIRLPFLPERSSAFLGIPRGS